MLEEKTALYMTDSQYVVVRGETRVQWNNVGGKREEK